MQNTGSKDTGHIAILLHMYGERGGELFASDLARVLAERGAQIDIVLIRDTVVLPQTSPGVRIVQLKASRLMSSIPHIRRYLQEAQPHTVLAIDEYAHLMLLAARIGLPVRVCLRIGTMFSETFARHHGLKDRFIIPMLVRLWYRFADDIIAVSEGIADDIAHVASVSRRRITVIPNPKPIARIRELAQAPAPHAWLEAGHDIPVLVTVGRLVTQKHIPFLIRTFAALRKEHIVRLLVLGGGDVERMRGVAREFGYEEDIDFLGHVENPYMYVRHADIFVSVSLWEGMPNGLLEAMICGLPIVASDCASGPREILAPTTDHTKRLTTGYTKEEFGVLTAIDDEKATVGALAEMLTDTQLRESYRAQSMVRARDYDMPNLITHYERILSRPRSRRGAVVCMTYGQVGDVLMQLAVLNAAQESGAFRYAAFIALAKPAIPKNLTRSYNIEVIDCSSPRRILRSLPGLIRLMALGPWILPPHSFGKPPRRPRTLAWLLSRLGGRVIHLSIDYDRTFVENIARAILDRRLTNQELTWKYTDTPSVLKKFDLSDGNYAVFHLFAANPMRTLPDARWISLIHAYLEKQGGTVLLTGSANDREHAERIAVAVESGCRVVCGELSFDEIASVTKRARVVLGVDTGITHLACLVGAQVVVVGNRSNPLWLPTYCPTATILTESARCVCTGRKQGNCLDETPDGPKFRCMLDIPDERILAALAERAIQTR